MARLCVPFNFLAVLLVVSIIASSFFMYQLLNSFYHARMRHKVRSKPVTHVKTILFWNPFYGDPYFNFGRGQLPFQEAGCPETRCFASAERTLQPIERWDAIVFHGYNVNSTDIPKRRSPRQRYVFYMLDAPSVPKMNLTPFDNFFNWTMTYRQDSDIPLPYGWVASKWDKMNKPVTTWIPEMPYDGPNVAAKKTKKAAWFVSNCDTTSQREVLANMISKSVMLDVYGRCGNRKCSKKKWNECMDMLDKEYKFYLAFENALCKDYATEKFFNALALDIVPVVYGNAEYSRLAPPGSYVNVNSFQSVDDLTDYLENLDDNDTLYNQHFWWKKYYKVVGVGGSTERNHNSGFCRLCQMLHLNKPVHSYKSMTNWWIHLGHCTWPFFYRDQLFQWNLWQKN